VHISHFLQNCKKGKPYQMDLPYQILAEDHGRKPVGESVPLKQMKEIV